MNKKTVVIAVIASSLGINGAFEFMPQNFSTEIALEGSLGATPLVINLTDIFGDNAFVIDTLEFVVRTNTMDLPEYKDYLVQGILHYDSNGEPVSRVFRDRVGTENKEYELVSRKQTVTSKFILGAGEDGSLNMDLSQCSFEFTWVTPSELSIYDIKAKDTLGKYHTIALDEVYTAYISEKEIISTNSNNHMPLHSDMYVSSIFGDDNGRWHGGADLCSQGDFTIYATENGIVEFSGWENEYDHSQGFGQYIRVRGDNGKYYYYGHCAELYVTEGEYVVSGQPIAYEGTTGYSTGNHLHYEIRENGEAINCFDELGIPNTYGYVSISDYIQPEEEIKEINSSTDYELAKKCLSLNKYFEAGSLKANAINPNDDGACSIGVIQMRGANAKALLLAVRDKNEKEFNRIAKLYDADIVDYVDDDKWETRTAEPGTPLFNFISHVLIQDWAIEAQYDFLISHEKGIIEDARKNGITDEKSIILYTRAFNYGPFTGSCTRLRDLGNIGECSFENAAATVEFLKANECIKLIDEMSFPIIEKEDIK